MSDFARDPMPPFPKTPWVKAHVSSLDDYRLNRALMAVMDHLGVRLEHRFGGDGIGEQWRVTPSSEPYFRLKEK